MTQSRAENFHKAQNMGYTEGAFMAEYPSRVSVAPSPVPERNDVLRVATLSDLHLPNDGASARVITENKPYLRRMDYVVLLGDMSATYGTAREYSFVDKFVRAMERPYTAINGNHEFYFVNAGDMSRFSKAIWDENTPEGKAAQLSRFQQFFGSLLCGARNTCRWEVFCSCASTAYTATSRKR
jgi:predicted MPP superfamily phosphohydrolase